MKVSTLAQFVKLHTIHFILAFHYNAVLSKK